VCWYSGKALFEKLGGATPVGLLQTSVGGSPIEYWLPPSAKFNRNGTTNVNACESDRPQCDNKYNDTFFFTDIVTQLVPYTHGAMVWDQAERDVKCPTATSAYACMQALLATSWRREFKSASAAFVAVQLPGYTGALNNGTGSYPGYISAEMVWKMRLQQAKGAAAVPNASVVVTYDEVWISSGIICCELLKSSLLLILQSSLSRARPPTAPARTVRCTTCRRA